MSAGKFVSYIRVSTKKQGDSGLGLEAQQAAVADYLNRVDGKLLTEFREVESGKKNDRPQLKTALHYAKVTGATLIIAKLDRLSRNVAFIANLQEAGVKFVCTDMPDATEMTVQIFAALAQWERKKISERTTAALKAAQARGKKLGNAKGVPAFNEPGNPAALKAVKANADKFAENILPIVEDIRASGTTTLQGIAAELNERGILTARDGKWHPTTVRNLLQRASASN